MRFLFAFVFAGVLFIAVLPLVPPSLLAILRPGEIKHVLREVVDPPSKTKDGDTIPEVVDPPPMTKDDDIAKIRALASKYNLK